jgi:hypothetical protein
LFLFTYGPFYFIKDFMNPQDYKGEPVLIEPRIKRGEKPISSRIIMTFTPLEIGLAFQAYNIDGSEGRQIDLSWIYPLSLHEMGPELAGPAMGAPAAVFLLERLIALGGKYFLTIGTCGSLQLDLPVGSFILPVDALSEEGTSTHYGIKGDVSKASPELLQRIERELIKKKIPFRKGRIWTTDAPFRETVEKVRKYRDMGILGVDMETSALMTVSHFRGVSLASLLVVSDELGTLKWRPGFNDPKFIDSFKKGAILLRDIFFEESDGI